MGGVGRGMVTDVVKKNGKSRAFDNHACMYMIMMTLYPIFSCFVVI